MNDLSQSNFHSHKKCSQTINPIRLTKEQIYNARTSLTETVFQEKGRGIWRQAGFHGASSQGQPTVLKSPRLCEAKSRCICIQEGLHRQPSCPPSWRRLFSFNASTAVLCSWQRIPNDSFCECPCRHSGSHTTGEKCCVLRSSGIFLPPSLLFTGCQIPVNPNASNTQGRAPFTLGCGPAWTVESSQGWTHSPSPALKGTCGFQIGAAYPLDFVSCINERGDIFGASCDWNLP